MNVVFPMVVLLLLLTACGGGSSTNDDSGESAWDSVTSALNASDIENIGLIVGDRTGEKFRYAKGNFDLDSPYRVASASKWLTSATLLSLVETGVMTLSDQPQDYLDYWTDDVNDERSLITLEQLLSFTAGYHQSPNNGGCIGNESFDIQACVQIWYNRGSDATPGTTYYYGPVPMQVAAAMAEVATGQAWRDIVSSNLSTPLGMISTDFEGNNPRASGSATSSAVDYAMFLEAQLTGQFLSNSIENLFEERTTGVEIISRPSAIEQNALDWQYALGIWRECSSSQWDSACESQTIISSPGAFGWYPWIDFDEGYYAVLAMEEISLLSQPSVDSINLGDLLKPLIMQALNQH